MLKPAKKIVICEAVEDETDEGLVLTAAEKGNPPERGKILAIGKGKPPIEIKKGDIVVHRRYSENKVLIKGKELNFIDFKDIVAVE